MVFSSLVFLCVFLPATFALYAVMPGMRARNLCLTVASLLFYAYGEPVFVIAMLASVFANWTFGRSMSRLSGHARRATLACAVVCNLAFIAVFKYAGMLVETIALLGGPSLPVPTLPLPLGISFFTFQALSYVIDVYRGEVSGTDGLGKVLLYISFFPQIVAGPIVKYHDIEAQIFDRSLELGEVARGLRRFVCGLAKKVLVSNAMATVADALFALEPASLGAPAAWLAAVAYLMQIYYDFSGYSDMAIGLGHMFGFTIPENFEHPYASVTIKEFWRRWHISLSTWFKEYLYIPLGGNRQGRLRAGLNKVVVFFLCGLWHGANWTFVVWGLVHGAFSLLEEALPLRRLPRALGHLYTMLVVTVAFVIFRANTLAAGVSVIAQMFSAWDVTKAQVVTALAQLTPTFLLALAVAVVLAVPHPRVASVADKSVGLQTAGYALALALLAVCVLELSAGTYNPFIYFRF